ncbi:hypothetical protein OG413_10185 [Streptomyces sp. NBC_01433]|uniref:hypothetical protein n=1 Tax=Streptomyces sp. NBC_01433 TaxID=2903864 RepID=UPI002257D799|nr:hypothetical protein [Streptomyces sp. NBC_01433]MCX4675670.1 hypothetical protein [Streptomyces sp. NBC_01433]
MRRQTFGSTGRRGTVIAASAAVLCLGGALVSCAGGSGGGDGYAAVGAAAAGPGRAPTGAAGPSGTVTLVPLDKGGSGAGSGSGGPSAAKGGAGDSGRPADLRDTENAGTPPGSSGAPGTPGPEPSSGTGHGSGSGHGTGAPTTPPSPAKPSSPGTPSTPGTTAPPAPAALQLSGPERAAADKRWCEKVSMEFRNTGGSAVRSGTVTFATHIIGALGVDWATLESTQPLPAPIDAGAVRKKTYTVCVDAWRVPLGMRVETQDVTAVWK